MSNDNEQEILPPEITNGIDEKTLSLADELSIDLSTTLNQRMTFAAQNINQAYKRLVEAGLLLKSVKDECSHGEFGELCEKHGFTRQRASEAIRYATLAAALPANKRRQILELPKKKVLALAALDNETVSQALEDDDLVKDIADLDVAALRSRIKQLESKNADLSIDLQTKTEAEKELKSKLKNKQNDTGLPDYVAMIRHESNALADKSMLCTEGFESLLNELITAIQTGDSDLAKFNAQAGAALLIQARAATARLISAYRTIDTQLSATVDLDGGIPADCLFTDNEIDQAIMARSEMVAEHRQEAIIRENERIAKKPRGRGAPKKTKAVK